jgi:hypothetical protein
MGLLRVISKLVLIKSIVLGLLVLGVWVRSYYVCDTFWVTSGAKSASLAWAQGILIYTATADGTDALSLARMTSLWTHDDPQRKLETSMPGANDVRLGFSSTRTMPSTGGVSLTLTVPLWFVFPLIASRALFWLARCGVNWYLKAPRSTGWCAICQCDALSVNNHCVRCGGPVFSRAF